jgi:hypothetical protein
MALNKKKFRIEVFDSSGSTYKGLITDVAGVFWNKTINGGNGELTLRLPRKIDDFGYGDEILEMNKVDIYIIDNDEPNGKPMYSGFMDTFEGQQVASQEIVSVRCLGYHTMLALAPYKDGSNPTIKHRSINADDIFKDIIDKYLLYHTDSPIHYTASSVQAGGNVISDDFNGMSCMEALDRLMKKSGEDWFWYVDAENVAWFQQKPATATHSFIYGKHITRDFSFDKSIREVINEGLFWNGRTEVDDKLLSKLYRKTDFQTQYWPRFAKVSDQRITNQTTANNLMGAYLDANHTKNHGINFSLIDNTYSEKGYDIESIEPGHTCEVLSIKDDQVFSNNMMITALSYTMERVVLRLEDLRTLTSRRLNDVRKTLDQTTYGDGQPVFTTVVL